jgi:hypothetical protein
MPPRGPIPQLAEISSDQWGLVTRQQALAAGVPPATLARNIKGGLLEHIAQGVYLLAGSPRPDHLELRAAWLQLAPETPVWDRKGWQGVVSHRSAAALYGLGHLVADVQEFTLPHRRQTSRAGVRIHVRKLEPTEWVAVRGLLVTLPSRIAADLLAEHEDPEAVAQITVDALRDVQDYPRSFVARLAPLSSRLGFQRDSGRSVLRWLLEQGGDDAVTRWSFEQLDHESTST